LGPDEAQALSGLRADRLFDKVIAADHVYGPLLREIKAAYDAFLRVHGASLPDGPVAPHGFVQEKARLEASAAVPTKEEELPISMEAAVDAARRPWMVLAGSTARGEETKVLELERENTALRGLVRRLRTDLKAESRALEEGASLTQDSQSLLLGRMPAATSSVRPVLIPESGAISSRSAASTDSDLTMLWAKDPRDCREMPPRPAEVPALPLKHMMDMLDEESDGSGSYGDGDICSADQAAGEDDDTPTARMPR